MAERQDHLALGRGRRDEHARRGDRLRAAAGCVRILDRRIQAFAGGAILTMLADEMLPEAFDYAERNRSVGLAVAFGFAVSASLSFTT
jgi:hypothetical protein